MGKKYHISEINILEYLTKFSCLRTSLSDFYVKTRNCRILGLSDESGTGKGLLVAESGTIVEILFITAENEDHSIKKALLNHLIRLFPSGTGIEWRIIDNAQNEKLAYEQRFCSRKTLNIFHTIGADHEYGDEFLREYEKLFAFMERRGYRTVSFNELSEAELSQIRDNPAGEFDSALRPEVLMDDRMGGFSDEMSFASIKDGKVVAYSVIRCPDAKSCIFEIICVAKSEQKNGIFVLPFYKSLCTMKASGAKSALFAVYENNSEMLKLVEKRFSKLIVSKSIQHNLLFFVH